MLDEHSRIEHNGIPAAEKSIIPGTYATVKYDEHGQIRMIIWSDSPHLFHATITTAEIAQRRLKLTTASGQQRTMEFTEKTIIVRDGQKLSPEQLPAAMTPGTPLICHAAATAPGQPELLTGIEIGHQAGGDFGTMPDCHRPIRSAGT